MVFIWQLLFCLAMLESLAGAIKSVKTKEENLSHLAKVTQRLTGHCQVHIERTQRDGRHLESEFFESLNTPVIITSTKSDFEQDLRGCWFPLFLSLNTSTLMTAMASASSPEGIALIVPELPSSTGLKRIAAVGKDLGKNLHLLEIETGIRTQYKKYVLHSKVICHDHDVSGEHFNAAYKGFSTSMVTKEIRVSFVYISPYVVVGTNPIKGYLLKRKS